MYKIAQLRAGGGWLGIGPMPGRGGDYAGDLATLLAWRPTNVVSMTEAREFHGPLPLDLARADVVWEHLPFSNFDAPPPEIQALWPEVSMRLQAALAGGGRVFAHCYGGCGRSGMALLRLMAELGEAPDAALARLRAVRPCAVENTDQLAWSNAGAPG